MESLQDRSSSSEGGPPSEAPRRGKMGRIAGHTRGLVEDLRQWIDLRIDLAILEVEEQVDDLRNEVALGVTLAFLGFFAALFVFTTIALGLGWLLGHPFWGFLTVSVLLVLTLTALSKARPELLPPSNLFEQIRGETDEPAEEDRPNREAQATVETDDAAASPDNPSSLS